MQLKNLVLSGFAVFSLMLTLVGTVAAASVVTNGSFEDGTAPGVFLTVNPGDTDITDWTVVSGNVDYIGSYWVASDGDRSIDLTGNQAGVISQDFPTVVGREYTVTFDLSGNPAGGPALKELEVSAAGETVPFSYDVVANTTSLTDMKWQQESFNFVATATTTTITFTSLTPGYFGPALDNVSVDEVLTSPTTKDQCKNGGWMTFNNPTFKNQGDCVSYVQSSVNAVANKLK